MLADECELVIGLGFQDETLEELATSQGLEVVYLPEAELTHDYRSHRRQMALVHQRRMASPTSAIEKLARTDRTLDARTRLLGRLRVLRDSLSVARPGGSAAIEGADDAAVRTGSNLSDFKNCLDSVDPDLVLSLTPYHDQDALTLFAVSIVLRSSSNDLFR